MEVTQDSVLDHLRRSAPQHASDATEVHEKSAFTEFSSIKCTNSVSNNGKPLKFAIRILMDLTPCVINTDFLRFVFRLNISSLPLRVFNPCGYMNIYHH